VKIKILIKVALPTIPGKYFLTTTLTIFHDTANHGEVIEIFEVNNNQIKPDMTDIDSNDIEKKFCVEVGGPAIQIFMFGAKIQPTMRFSKVM
jgi:hypothetical protein